MARPRRRLAILLLAALLAVFAASAARAQDVSAGSLSLLPHLAESMDRQQELAQACIQRWGSTPRSSLAAVYLHAHLTTMWRDKLLTCSIDNLIKNVAPSTPLDIFVFVRAEMYDTMSEELAKHLGANAERVCVLPIPQEQWSYQLPRATPYQLPNNTNRYKDYLYMGQWRLLVPNNIMHSLGYPYTVQVDDDLYVTEPMQFNIVEHMRSNGKKIGTHRVSTEKWHIMYGLPEMARFFLLSNQLQPGTSLFQHLFPPNMDGLFSPSMPWSAPGSPRKGYDTSVLFGNFLIMSTDLWREAKVQDWIALCMSSGGLERHRWQEQGVMAFIWLLFTNADELLQLEPPQFTYVHGRNADDTQRICGVVNPYVLSRQRFMQHPAHRRAARGTPSQ